MIAFLGPRRALSRKNWARRQLSFLRTADQAHCTSVVLSQGGTLPQAIGSTLAGALVAARTEPGPGDEVAVRWEPAHVGADLRDDNLRADVPNTGDRRYLFDCGPKGRDACFDWPIDSWRRLRREHRSD